MPEPPPKTFAEHLLAQDPPLSEEQHGEHRRQLEEALADASRREFRVRITVLVLWLLCLVYPMVLTVVFAGRGVGLANGWRGRILNAYPLEMYVLLIVTIVETVSYFIRFLPARLRAGSALNRSILLDLDRRITDLAGRIDRTTK
jgi:uncharacterized RDD family membrane protein YckC